MRFPWSKTKKGTHKSTSQRLTESKVILDNLLIQTYIQDLREHPTYAREMARQKLGMTEMSSDKGEYVPERSAVDNILEVKDMKESMDSIFGTGGQKQGIMSQLPEIFKSLPDLGVGLQELAKGMRALTESGGLLQTKQAQLPQPPQPQLEQPQPDHKEETMEQKTVDLAVRLLQSPAEQAASELYHFKDDPEDIRSLAYRFILTSDIDSIVEQLPSFLQVPQYKFLVPLFKGLNIPELRQWLALVHDECRMLETGEKPSEIGEKLEEMGVSFEEGRETGESIAEDEPTGEETGGKRKRK